MTVVAGTLGYYLDGSANTWRLFLDSPSTGQHEVEGGDTLQIRGPAGEVLFDGVIDPIFVEKRVEGKVVSADHWHQRGFDLATWEGFFIDELPATLTKNT